MHFLWTKYASCSNHAPDVDHLPALHFPLPADGDMYCSGVDPILVPTDSLTASHHFVAAACQHLGKAAYVNKAFLSNNIKLSTIYFKT